MAEKFLEYLSETEKILSRTDHLVYITLPMLKNKRLLIKVITDITEAVLKNINAILHYEYIKKRINLVKESSINLDTFFVKCAPSYRVNESELEGIKKLLVLSKAHKTSPFEFIKDGRLVILSDSLSSETMAIEKIKEFLAISKSLLNKTKIKIKEENLGKV